MDFDGVFTDNRVIVDQNGVESVCADRSDGLGFGLLKAQTPVECLIISKERNPVVAQRAAKLGIPVLQAVDDKATALKHAMRERNLAQEETIFVGNDVNDLPTLDIAGYFVAPADSHSEVLRRADLVLKNKGGRGALRELCDKLIAHWQSLD
jgi:N-acylneuraminate cytidylyltransferase